jgi:transposase-like protein
MASKKTRTKEFKEDAVRLAQQNGNANETVCNLGLQLSGLTRLEWLSRWFCFQVNQQGKRSLMMGSALIWTFSGL